MTSNIMSRVGRSTSHVGFKRNSLSLDPFELQTSVLQFWKLEAEPDLMVPFSTL